MSPADRRLVTRDRAVPGLATVLDDTRLTEHVQASWSSDVAPPQQVRTTYLRYKAGTSLVATAELTFGDHRTFALIAATSPQAAGKLGKIVDHATGRGGDLPLLLDDSRRLLVAPLVADRHLPGIHKLDRRMRWIDDDLRDADLEVLSYKPHRRLVVRASIRGEPVAVVKVHAPRLLGEMTAALRWATTKRSDRLALPHLIGSDADHGVLLTTWVPGDALDDIEPDRQRATLRGVGKLLGRLHQTDTHGLPRRDPGSLDPEKIITAVHALRPDLVDRVRQLLRDNAHALPPASRLTPVHGDLSPDQVVHGPDGVALIDLDRTGIGSPGSDLASWVAAEVVMGRRQDGDLRLPDAFWEGYLGVDGPASEQQVTDRIPIELLRRVTDPFKQRLPDWPDRMTTIVQAATRSTALSSAS
ncbi:MAG: aminoglycoside phosphotransferase family protein [Intrasporangiaceae bacterium]|nr:aminoglycoside phosphotransferase family protein [Intrasporangiaceae bacterium]